MQTSPLTLLYSLSRSPSTADWNQTCEQQSASRSFNTLTLLNYEHVQQANGFPFPLSAAGYLCTQHKKRRARGSHRHTQGGPWRGGAADSLWDPREDITGLYFILSISKSRMTYFEKSFLSYIICPTWISKLERLCGFAPQHDSRGGGLSCIYLGWR